MPSLRGDARPCFVSTTNHRIGPRHSRRRTTLIVERADNARPSRSSTQIRGPGSAVSDRHPPYAFLFYPRGGREPHPGGARATRDAGPTTPSIRPRASRSQCARPRDPRRRRAGFGRRGSRATSPPSASSSTSSSLNEAVAGAPGASRRVAGAPGSRVDARIDAYVPQQYVQLRGAAHRHPTAASQLAETEDELRELQAVAPKTATGRCRNRSRTSSRFRRRRSRSPLLGGRLPLVFRGGKARPSAGSSSVPQELKEAAEPRPPPAVYTTGSSEVSLRSEGRFPPRRSASSMLSWRLARQRERFRRRCTALPLSTFEPLGSQ